MAHQNKTKKYPVDTTCQNMCHAYSFGLNPGRKKMRFQPTLNKTLCPTPQHLTHRQLKHRQSTKTNKTMLSASPSWVFHTKFIISQLKRKKVFHRNGTRTASVGVLQNWDLKILCPTDSEHKFNKKGFEN